MNQTTNSRHDAALEPLVDDARFPDADGLRSTQVLAAAQNEVLEFAAGNASVDALLNALVRAAQGLAQEGARAAIFIVDPQGASLRFRAAAGLPKGYIRAVGGFAIGPTSPSCGKAAYTGREIIVRDVAQDPLWAPYLSHALEHGIRACWSFPLRSAAGKLLGTFALYHRIPREPQPRDLELVKFLADTAAIIIEHHQLIEQRRRESEYALRRSEQFETLLSQAPLGVYVVDADLRFQHANGTAQSAFKGIPDLIGRDFAEVVDIAWPAPFAHEIVRLFRRTLETGASHIGSERSEKRRDHGDTECYEWEIHRVPLHDGRHGVVCYFREISRQVKARLAIEATDEALKAADHHKDEFLATLAHELRSPLAALHNALNVIKARPNDAGTLARSLPIMQRQVGQMARLIEDLLDVSRISQGKIELRKERIDLARAVNHAVEVVRPLCARKEQDLTVTGPQQPIFINADPARLVQMVGNLLNNACKFTGRGGFVRLTVEREGAQAVVRVQDTGIGIAADQVHRIFEVFTQLNTSCERTQSGLGIGLALVKTLAEMHGGTVEAHSAGPGLGSEFVLSLPLPVEAPAD